MPEVMPAMCNPDYTAMELIHARLIRKTTCANGCVCDYTICGDKDEEYLKQHEEYIDDEGIGEISEEMHFIYNVFF